MNFDWKQFYLSAQGRVNRKQFWLRLVLTSFVISIVLLLIDMAIGTYSVEDGVGLLSSISRWRSSFPLFSSISSAGTIATSPDGRC
jgi:uncharacterized membrane protein YhaH (DUF805 family)